MVGEVKMKNEKQLFKIPCGESNFEFIRTKRYIYVDKTHFIPQLEGTTKLIHLRPRRFGKSLFVSMLEAYYDVAREDKFDQLFGGLYVHTAPTMDKNNYYVLHFDFSGIATVDVETVLDGFTSRVRADVKAFVDYYQLDIKYDSEGTPASILNSFLTAFRGLGLKHKIYILIDEYDHFTNAVLDNGIPDFMALVNRGGIVRSFYEIIKINCKHGVIERFFITGVMSVSLDCMTSGFNIATNITIDKRFANMVGFTSEEVKQILCLPLEKSFSNDRNDMKVELMPTEQEEIYEIWRQNYNGYLFSESSKIKVFNATLIMYYLQQYVEEREHPKDLVDPNLNQSGTTIKNLAELANREVNYEVVEEVVKERVVAGKLSKFIKVDEKYDRNDFMTLLFNIGLLTIKEPGVRTRFEIPNKIIETIYFQYLSELTQKRLGCILDVKEQEIAIDEIAMDGKINKLSQLVSAFLASTSGRNDNRFSEKEIKLTYLFILSTTNQYFVYDEFPALRGYSDVVILKTPASFAQYEYVIELKHTKKGEKDETTTSRVEKEFAAGVSQIAKYMEDKRLANRPNLKKFVVVFAGVEVARMEEI